MGLNVYTRIVFGWKIELKNMPWFESIEEDYDGDRDYAAERWLGRNDLREIVSVVGSGLHDHPIYAIAVKDTSFSGGMHFKEMELPPTPTEADIAKVKVALAEHAIFVPEAPAWLIGQWWSI